MSITEVRQPVALPVVLGLAVLVLGLAIGWFAPALAGGLVDLIERTPLPVPRLLSLVESLPRGWTVGIAGGLGLVVGGFVGMAVLAEAPRVSVADDHLEHEQEDRAVWIERSDVSAVFRDKDDLVLLQPDGTVRARLDVDTLSPAKVSSALQQHGWPWRDADPYEHEFERWIDGRPGFTPTEHEVLRRRLAERKDAAACRKADEDLAALGLVARVRDDRIQVRRVAGADRGARGADR